MAFYDPSIFEVHVLLVDHDIVTLFETARLLQFNSYKVTPVHDASVASSMLSSPQCNTKFNVVMVDVKTSNIEGFKLVHEAVSIDLPVIVMSSTASPTLVKCAIEDGAFLFMQKPTAPDELKYLWQHILREMTRKSKDKGKYAFGETSTNYNQDTFYMSGEDNNLFEVDRTTECVTMYPNVSRKKVFNGQKGRVCEVITFNNNNNNNNNNDNNNNNNNNINNNNAVAGECMGMKPKMCTEWTSELHEKFMAAVQQLGEGRCFPKDILELMNVPGLTRMQVASHLQKCRHGWQPSKERQGRPPKASNPRQTKKYGIFPRLIRGCQPVLTPKDNEQVPMPTTENDITMPVSDDITQSMGQKVVGTWDNSSMNDVSNENAMMQAAQDQMGFQFDFAGGGGGDDDDALIVNNFNLNDFDYDHTLLGQGSEDAAAAASASFWSSWIANFARD
ncbi:hypothetical protein CASFOL_014011 [Castilleja foliolosa]|uniref:Uncharacterized protein n=1 Tax=Castilleja foliolosa TaxID=1961234 RepID=A0ABD3DQP2_9LAMI